MDEEDVTPETVDDSLPVMYEHCCTVYKAMSQTARQKGRVRIWDGFLTRLVNDQLRMSTPYYSHIRTHLMRMGCIHQVRRGGSNTTSQWALLQAPSRALWEKMPDLPVAETKRNSTAVLSQRIDELTNRVVLLEEAFKLGVEVDRSEVS